jgi:hypothetical protein
MCELTSGFGALNCDSAGGVDKWYVGSLRDEATGAANYTYTRTAGEITAMANVGSKLFYEILVDAEMSQAFCNTIGTRENASAGYDHNGTIKLAGNTATNIDKFEKLSKDRVCLIALMNDGTYEVFGIDKGLKIGVNRSTGMKFEDFNGNELAFSGKEKRNAPKIGGSIVTTLLS